MDEIFTIGHSNRSTDEFIEILREFGVELVADVRRFPGSARNPQFGGESLAESLKMHDIGYRHFPELGGRRGKPAPDSPNTGWRVEAFRAYADRMAHPDWLDALSSMEEVARKWKAAIMCAEAVPWRCHRRLISDILLTRGWLVRHLIGRGRAADHVLQDFARILPDNRIVYPAPE